MSQIDRRSFLGYGSLATAATLLDGLWLPAWAQDARGAGMTSPLTTATGRVRGLIRYGVNQFYGIPYAASTAGANRFLPPQKPAPWTACELCLAPHFGAHDNPWSRHCSARLAAASRR